MINYMFIMYKDLKMPPVYEELSAITVIDIKPEAKYIVAKDPLKRVLRGDEIYKDTKVHEIAILRCVTNYRCWREMGVVKQSVRTST